jgi:hypothetical protein
MNMRLLIILVLIFPIAICSAEETEIQGSYDIINLLVLQLRDPDNNTVKVMQVLEEQ